MNIENVMSLGLGAVVAVIVMNWKREDDRRYSNSLESIISSLLEVVKSNTTATTQQSGAINALESMVKILIEREKKRSR